MRLNGIGTCGMWKNLSLNKALIQLLVPNRAVITNLVLCLFKRVNFVMIQ